MIKLTGAEGETVALPRFEAANDTNAQNPNVVAPYLLWDLSSNAGSTVQLNGDKVSGSIYAPGVDLVLNQSSPFEGTVISETIVTRGGSGELHHYRFEGSIECDEPSPTPTPTPTSPTASPTSPTATPTSPTPTSPTATPASPTASATSETPSSPTTTTGTTSTTPETAMTDSDSSGGVLASTGARAGLLAAFVAGVAAIWAGAVILLRRRGTRE